MKKKMQEVGFDMMPKSPAMVKYLDRLVLYDNLDIPFKEGFGEEIDKFINTLPIKINFAVIAVCVKGNIEIDCNLSKLSLTPGGVAVLVPGTIIEKASVDQSGTYIIISVPDQSYAPGLSFHNAAYSQKNFTSPLTVQLDEDVFRSGLDSYRQLKSSLLAMGDKVTDDLVKSYIMVMAGLAAVNFHKWKIINPESKATNKEVIMKEFLANVEEFHSQRRDVTFYAEKAGLTPKYFAKIIHSESGKKPLDWIRGYVILDAKQMLKSGQYSVTQICEKLNFDSRSHFNRYFKEETGVSPSEYIKSSGN